MLSFELPRTLTLPTGKRVIVRRTAASRKEGATTSTKTGRPRTEGAPLFSDVIDLFVGRNNADDHDDHKQEVDVDVEIALAKGKTPIDIRDLALRDFHVVRAVLTKAGLLLEDEIEIDCCNCGAILIARPCAGLETGPWEDGEAVDPELDRTLDLDVPIDVVALFGGPPIAIGRVRQARTVTLRDRTVRDAMPLFQALSKDPLVIDQAVAVAMGIGAIGSITDPRRIARVLSECEEASFGAITDAFLAAHYPLRLASDVFCTKCKARNTVDAPHEREFELTAAETHSAEDGESSDVEDNDEHADEPHIAGSDATREGEQGSRTRTPRTPRTPFPNLADFVELAHRIAEPLIAEIPGEKAELVVDDGTPAVDDGGEPLLGSYVPPPPKDAPVPTQPPTVTIYYRTFEKIVREEGGVASSSFDWEDELHETIEHELEHHVFFLRGDDPMDEEEHAEIDREVVRVVGRGEVTRRTLAVFGLSVPDFFRRAWPLILVAAVVLAITLAEGRCGVGNE